MPPSVQGARPGHRAHVRVVKLRGAPAHDVTADLDEGRITEQEPIRVDRSLPPTGKESAAPLRCHTENRVVVSANRTVVFQSAFSVSRFSECLCRP